MNKSSNISKYVFGVLALITVVITVLFFLKGVPECDPWKDWFNKGRLGDEPKTPLTDLLMNWSYIKVILGVVAIVISAIVVAVVKGVNWKTIAIVIGAIVVIGLIAFFMSKGSFGIEYPKPDDPEHPYSGLTHGLVETGLNFFYITLGVSILCIIYSVIRSGK